MTATATLPVAIEATLPTDLLKALPVIAKVVNRHSYAAILTHLLIESDGTTITARSTDLDVHAAFKTGAVSPDPFAFTVEAKAFVDYAKAASGPIEVVIREFTVDMISDAGRSTFPTLPADEFPPLPKSTPDPKGDSTIELGFANLVTSFATVATAASAEEARGAVLMGVCFEVGGRHVADGKNAKPNGLTLTGCDGYRLLHVSPTTSRFVSKGTRSYIVPRAALAPLKAIKFDKKAPPAVAVTFDALTARFHVAGFTVHVRIVDGTYPDYSKVIPQIQGSPSLRVNAARLAETVKAGAKIADSRASIVSLDRIDDETMVVIAQSDRLGTFERKVATYGSVGLGGVDPVMAFNGAFLAETLGAFGKADVTMRIIGPISPLVIHDDATNLVAVQMPVRR